ncbi:MAG: DUF4443 domain-containing protein [Candidatus Hydrothermarchaeales archaeon]
MAIYKKSEKANPRFDELHLIIALKIISDKKTVGRKRLMEELDVGEGSTRTILDKLKKEKLISSSSKGHKITKKGRTVLKRNMPKGEEINATDLTLSDENFALLIKDVQIDIKSGIEQRDEAIKAGADCAVTLLFDGEKLRFPKDFELKLGHTDAIEEVLAKFHPKKGDIIVIGGGSNKINAIKGALAASKALCK